ERRDADQEEDESEPQAVAFEQTRDTAQVGPANLGVRRPDGLLVRSPAPIPASVHPGHAVSKHARPGWASQRLRATCTTESSDMRTVPPGRASMRRRIRANSSCR